MSKEDWRTRRAKDERMCEVMAAHFMSWLQAARALNWWEATKRAKTCAALLDKIEARATRERAMSVGWGVQVEAQRLRVLAELAETPSAQTLALSPPAATQTPAASTNPRP